MEKFDCILSSLPACVYVDGASAMFMLLLLPTVCMQQDQARDLIY